MGLPARPRPKALPMSFASNWLSGAGLATEIYKNAIRTGREAHPTMKRFCQCTIVALVTSVRSTGLLRLLRSLFGSFFGSLVVTDFWFFEGALMTHQF